MRFEDQSPSGDQPRPSGAPLPPPPVPSDPGRRRRSTRSWSSPSTAPSPWPAEAASTRPAPRPAPIVAPPPAPAAADLGSVAAQLRELRAELQQLSGALAAGTSSRDATLVTGAELAATIEALGTTLGNGMATLLTEHRNLLARDIDAAADRILEELAQRLRTSGTQTADAVEERLRLVTGKALGDLGDQVDLRLDQLLTDVSGLRAVMLEIPDQTAVVERLDQVVESVGTARNLTTEIAALRRRISLRGEKGEGAELSDAQLDDLADRIAARLRRSESPGRGSRAAVRLSLDDDLDHDAEPDEDDAEPPTPAPRRAGRRRS